MRYKLVLRYGNDGMYADDLLFQNKSTLARASSRQKKPPHTQANQHTRQRNMHEQTEILTVSHTNTHSHRQQSGCWLLPVGLWSLNCLSDSTLSKFTMRDPALCLPELLRLKHTQKRTCSQMQPKHRQTYTHTQWRYTLQITVAWTSAKVLGKWVLGSTWSQSPTFSA